MATTTQAQMHGGSPTHWQCNGLMEGNFRDADGVDRVAGPPDSLKPLLVRFRDITRSEGIDLNGEFESGGGSRFGTISKGQFRGLLVRTFKMIHFTDDILQSITDAYGTGLEDKTWGGCVEIAWMDFCEDVAKAEGSGSGHSSGVAGRDDDGTVDLVPDPPEAMKKWLLVLKLKNKQAGIDMYETFRGQGAHPNGTWAKGQFTLCLMGLYKEFSFTKQLLFSMAANYGCGEDHPAGGKTHVAWKDFIEDINDQSEADATGEMRDMARARGGAVLGS